MVVTVAIAFEPPPGTPKERVPASRADITLADFEDKDLAYPPASYETSVTATESTVDVTVTARTILRDLVLQADRLDPSAEVDRALVTLLPGESVTFRVTGAGPLSTEDLLHPPVLRCVNDTPRPA